MAPRWNFTTATTVCSDSNATCNPDADCSAFAVCAVKQVIYEISSKDGSILNVLDPSTVTGRLPTGLGIGQVSDSSTVGVSLPAVLLLTEVPGPNVIRYRNP